MTTRRLILLCAIGAVFAGVAAAEFRFPMPEFDSGYKHPQTAAPPPSLTLPAVDIALLAGLMALTAWVVLKRRSRREVLGIAVVSLLYFGFYRKGCICPVGSVQNIANVLVGDHTVVPVVVAVFFFLPILFALYFGRVFCAGVCPLGAIQEVCAVYPVQLSRPLEQVLGLFAYAYLGLAVAAIATGSGFLICRYDPFVGFFRLGGSFNMLLMGGILLAAGVFIARPYCRFLCPYGVLLRWASSFSKWHASITPAECIQCKLCEHSCPYGAIVVPTPEDRPEDRKTGVRRLALLLTLTPLVMFGAAAAGMAAHEFAARLHPTVRLAERIAAEESGRAQGTTIDSDAFRADRQAPVELYATANAIRERFRWATAGFGAFMGLVVCGRLIRLSFIRSNKDYVADRGACLSCARCFDYCPVGKEDADIITQ